ncbi:hypothetical protein [Paenibacillus sp. TH7-28]
MTRLKAYLTRDCIAFTFVVLAYSILSLLEVLPPFETVLTFQLFAITSCCIAILMLVTERIAWKRLWTSIAADILAVLLSVFIVGPLLGVFSFDLNSTAVIGGMSILAYFAVYGVMIMKDRADASRINRKLRIIQKRELNK